MFDNVLLFLAAPALLALVIIVALGRYGSANNSRLGALVVVQALVYFCLSMWLGAKNLPLTLLDNGYFYVDSLSLYEIVITAIIFLLAAVYAKSYVASLLKQGEISQALLPLFYGAFCLLELVIIFGFMANNMALLWIFVELSTLLSVVLIVTLKAQENITAALKYVFVTSTAMLFSFVGIIVLFALSQSVIDGGSLNWTVLFAAASDFSPYVFNFAFILMLIGFVAKSGIVPFHTWLPSAYVRAPSVVAVASGAVLNLGLYAIIRIYALGHQVGDASLIKNLLLGLGLATIAIAAFSLLKRTNTKKVIAFSAVEQMGLALVGIGIASPLALFWVLFNQLAQVINKALLFFSAGIWHQQYLSNKFTAVREPFKYQPLASVGIIVGVAAAIGTPTLPIFLTKFNILSAMAGQPLLLAAALTCFLLLASGFGYYFIRAFSQPSDLPLIPYIAPLSMKLPIILCILLLLVLGLYLPPFLADIINTIISDLGLSG